MCMNENAASATGGAAKYLKGIQASAEQLFLSSIIVQVVVGLIIMGLHKQLIKVVTKKLPNKNHQGYTNLCTST